MTCWSTWPQWQALAGEQDNPSYPPRENCSCKFFRIGGDKISGYQEMNTYQPNSLKYSWRCLSWTMLNEQAVASIAGGWIIFPAEFFSRNFQDNLLLFPPGPTIHVYAWKASWFLCEIKSTKLSFKISKTNFTREFHPEIFFQRSHAWCFGARWWMVKGFLLWRVHGLLLRG